MDDNKSTQIPRRAVIYARVSGDDRDTEGRNLKSQLQMGREYCENVGYRIVAELAEDERGVSGAMLDAPQLQRAREMAAAGEYDVLVVREMDRLARSMVKQKIVEEELSANGVIIEYVLHQYAATPEGDLMKNIHASLAEYDRLKIRERTQRGILNSVRAGNIHSAGLAPFGYHIIKRDGKRTLAVYEPEAEIVRQIFHWYAYGDDAAPPLSMYKIAQRLTALGVETAVDKRRNMASKTIGRGRWNQRSIGLMLANETYTGTWRYHVNGSNEYTVDVDAVIDRDTFDICGRRRATNRQRSPRNTKYEYLFRGRLACGKCGRVMHAITSVYKKTAGGVERSQQYQYYRCTDSKARPSAPALCDTISYSAPTVDGVVWQQLAATLSDSHSLAQAIDHYRQNYDDHRLPLADQLERVDANINALTTRTRRLGRSMLDGEHTTAIFHEMQEEIETELTALYAQKAELLARIAAVPDVSNQAASLVALTDQIRDDIATLGDSFDGRRWLVERADVELSLRRVNGCKLARVSVLGVPLPEIEIPRTPRRTRYRV